MTICIVDTTIFCEILRIPSKSQQPEAVQQELRQHIQDGVILLLPMATIIETGNHIAQNGDGNLRREAGNRFSNQVLQAIDNRAPWTITRPLFDMDDLKRYLNEFPGYAMRGIGLGDLSIVKEFERQCQLHPSEHIFIWSLDQHLQSYNQQSVY